MSETLTTPEEQTGSPADILRWLHEQAFTHPEAYFDTKYQARIIDQTRAGEGAWMWIGVESEVGQTTAVQGSDGAEQPALNMAHITLEHHDTDDGKDYLEVRWLGVLCIEDELKIHLRRTVRDKVECIAFDEVRFLEDREVSELHQELQALAENIALGQE